MRAETSYAALEGAAASERLEIMGGFFPGPDDGVPEGTGTLLLLGPAPDFWDHLTAQPEWDGAPDPVDRWTTRVIGDLAGRFGGTALFPFGGPPWHPFIGWAKRSGRAWESPVTLLVHDRAGLMVSYRGALALPDRLDLPPPPDAPPCVTCNAPCVAACPPRALTVGGYDVPACKDFLARSTECRSGCLVRRACPVSQAYARDPRQSAYHMEVFR